MSRGLKFISWSGTNGYALAALDYVRGLSRHGVPVWWVPLYVAPGSGYQPWQPELGVENLNFFPALDNDSTYGDLRELIARCCQPCEYDTVVVQLPPEYWPIHFEPGCRNIGYCAWETDRLPPHWPALINLADLVLVPCRMNHDVCRAGGVIAPVGVLPHMLHPFPASDDGLRANARRNLGIGAATTVFYSINTWEPRKGNYDLLTAYTRAFTAADDVLLLLKTGPTGLGTPPAYQDRPVPLLLEEWLAKTRTAGSQAPPIRLIAEHMSGDQIEDLHRAGDVFVSLTRGEGWGLGGFEALARGRPVLMPGWGGQLDYLGEQWPWLVNYRLGPVTPWPQQSSFLASQRWAKPDIGHAAALMQGVRENLAEATRVAEAAAAGLHLRFSEAAVSEKLIAYLDQHDP